MLKIRLQRVGRKHEPSYRLVLTESENSTKSGRFKEILGFYDPRKIGEVLKADRIKCWLSVGVQTTPTINNLLVKAGIINAPKINVSKSKPFVKEPVVESPVVESAPVSEAPVAEAPAVEAPQDATIESVPEATN